MPDFLLELLSEEIPARMQAKARKDLQSLFEAELVRDGFTATSIETYATPRRLALIARGLPSQTAAVSEERRGPRADAPAQAIEGFLKSTGLTRDQLEEREDKKGAKVLFAVIEKPGRATAEVLAEAIPAVIRAFPWPKSMRWGPSSASSESQRWVRPLHGIVALLGDDVVPFEVAGVQSGAATVGHRFHHPGVVTIGNADDYAAKLRACHVLIDPAERRQVIAEGAAKAATAAGLTLVEDEGLLLENAGLTEWPVPLLGHFDPAFLEVPREVIQLTMRTNQKYFACTRADGSLAPNFVCTANIEAADGGEAIVAGNQKVLAARLSDAKFFWEQDLKIPLAKQAEKLTQIVFHDRLGTVADKVDRVAKLARWLVEEGIVKPSLLQGRGLGEGASTAPSASVTAPAGEPLSPTLSPEGERESLAAAAETAARLAKADLVTGMVGEFPELQGIIGGYLAHAQGHPAAIADAIRDHYKPVGQGDEVPTAPVTVAVSLADKFESIIALTGAGEKASGSRDPFGLRRAMLGVIQLIMANHLRLPIQDAYGFAYDLLYDDTFWRRFWTGELALFQGLQYDRNYQIRDTDEGSILFHGDIPIGPIDRAAIEKAEIERQAFLDNLYGSFDPAEFAMDRLKVQQREAGVRHDLIDAVFALGGEDDLVRLLARVHALQHFVQTPEGTNLHAGYKRAANILKKEHWDEATGNTDALSYTPENEEAALIAALDAAEPRAAAAVEAEDFEGAMAALASLRAPVDAFFDKVTVNDADPVKREARLNLLARMRAAVHRVADFSKIEG